MAHDPRAPVHTIRVTSKLTKIPAETLRVWERRYGFPNPGRVPSSGRRLYSDADIARLRAIERATRAGFRVGDVVTKSMAELEDLVLSGSNDADAGEPRHRRASSLATRPYPADGASASPDGLRHTFVRSLLEQLDRDDVSAVERTLRDAAIALGPRSFVLEVADPLVRAVGDGWRSGRYTIAQEHLMSECLSTQLRLVLAQLQEMAGSPVVLLTTLPGELHALGLQMVAVILAMGSAKPLVLGASLPPDAIADAAERHGASVVGLSITRASDLARARVDLQRLLDRLKKQTDVWLGGEAASALAPESVANLHVLSSWNALEELVHARRTKRR